MESVCAVNFWGGAFNFLLVFSVGLFVLLLEDGESIVDGLFTLLVGSNIPPTDDVLDGCCVPVWRVLKVRGGVTLDDDDSHPVGNLVEDPNLVFMSEVLAHKSDRVGNSIDVLLDGLLGHLG